MLVRSDSRIGEVDCREEMAPRKSSNLLGCWELAVHRGANGVILIHMSVHNCELCMARKETVQMQVGQDLFIGLTWQSDFSNEILHRLSSLERMKDPLAWRTSKIATPNRTLSGSEMMWMRRALPVEQDRNPECQFAEAGHGRATASQRLWREAVLIRRGASSVEVGIGKHQHQL